MKTTKQTFKDFTEKEKLGLFKYESNKMWDCKYLGTKKSLKINFKALYREGMTDFQLKQLKKYFKDDKGNFKDNVTYYLYEIDGTIRIFLEESDGLYDWKQNILAFNIKVKLGDFYRRYHLGFFATALTVFEDLKADGYLVKENMFDIFGYSHGAGAAPSFYSLLLHRSESEVIGMIKKFEQPKDIYMPRAGVKKECKEHLNFIQGSDIVTKVPMWNTALGIKIKIKGQKLSFFKNLLRQVFDHDIYWTDERKGL